MITTWFPPAVVGSGTRFYEVGKRLSKEHEVHVYTTGIEGYANEEELDGMHIHRYGVFNPSKSIEQESSFFSSKFSFNIFNLIKKQDIDIIDCNIVSKIPPFISYFVSKSTHTPFIETWHEVMHTQNFKLLNPALATPGFFLELFIPKLADINIAVSETTKRRLVELLKVNPDKTCVISNGVNLDKFKKTSAKKRYGRILYVGRLEEHKCVDVLLLAYYQLKKKYNGIELILIGKGPQKNYLQNLSKKLNLQDITFCDPVPYEQLVATMKSSWVLVLPSIREGQGIVLLEAMAAGTPPIAIHAEGSAVGDIVLNNYNGLLVPQDELEGAIEKLLIDEDLYISLRNNGLKFVEDYDWDKIAEKTEKVYEKLAGKR